MSVTQIYRRHVTTDPSEMLVIILYKYFFFVQVATNLGYYRVFVPLLGKRRPRLSKEWLNELLGVLILAIFELFLKPIKIETAAVLLRVTCFVKLVQ